jgi:flagellar basal body-associated protein FliL
MERMRKKRVWIIALLPIIILLWIVGWTLFWTGSKTAPKTKVKVEIATILEIEA